MLENQPESKEKFAKIPHNKQRVLVQSKTCTQNKSRQDEVQTSYREMSCCAVCKALEVHKIVFT